MNEKSLGIKKLLKHDEFTINRNYNKEIVN